jgi:hypothetical protein
MRVRQTLLRVSMDISEPTFHDCRLLKALFMNSVPSSMVNHNLVIQREYKPAIISLNKTDSIILLDCMSKNYPIESFQYPIVDPLK